MANAPTILKKIYVTLDCLLDTRMGALTLADPDFAHAVVTSGTYFNREEDLFKSPKHGVLSKENFNLFYHSRINDLLRVSLRTKMHQFITTLRSRFAMISISTPNQTHLEVEINAYPFVLSTEETAQILRIISYRLGSEMRVTMTRLSPEQITIDHVQKNYCAMIMYHYYEWLNLHEQAIRNTPIKSTGLYVPRLYFGEPPTHDQLKEFADHNTNPFDFQQNVLGPLVLIQYIPVEWYCIDLPEKLKTAA